MNASLCVGWTGRGAWAADAATAYELSRSMTEIPLLCRNGKTPIMIEDMIKLDFGLSSESAVVSFSLPPQVETDPPTVPPTYDYARMTFNDNTPSNCAEFDFMAHGRDCYEGQPTDALCGIVKQQLMSRPAIKYEDRFKEAVPDPGLRKAIGAAMTALPVTPDRPRRFGAFGWPCKAEGITELHAENMGIDDDNGGLKGIENLTGLTKLWLDGNPDIQIVNPVSTLPNLIEIHLSGCTGIMGDATGLKKLHNLQVLDFTGCTNIKSLNRTLYDPCTANGHYLSEIRDLNLSGCTGLTSCGISVFARMDLSHLETLNLSGCTGIGSLDSLVANTTLSSGAQIEVENVGVSEGELQEDISCLCSKGVIVTDNDVNICPASPSCSQNPRLPTHCGEHYYVSACHPTEGEDDCSIDIQCPPE